MSVAHLSPHYSAYKLGSVSFVSTTINQNKYIYYKYNLFCFHFIVFHHYFIHIYILITAFCCFPPQITFLSCFPSLFIMLFLFAVFLIFSCAFCVGKTLFFIRSPRNVINFRFGWFFFFSEWAFLC